MFEVGFTEIILILGIALLVLGPEKLPKLAAQVGRWVGRARSMARQLRQQLDEEVTIVPTPDFDPAAKRPPGTPSPGTPPPATPTPAQASTRAPRPAPPAEDVDSQDGAPPP